LPFIAVLCAAVLAACGSPASTTANIVTVAQARAAAQNYGLVDSKAAAQCNAKLNDTVEAGDLAAIDDNARGFNPAVCAVLGTPPTPSPSATPNAIANDELVVPRASSYPAFFLEYINTDTGDGDGEQPNIFVLESDKRGARWKARYQVKLSAGGLLAFHRDAQGYAVAPLAESAGGYKMTPAATCTAAADAFDAAYAGTSTPSAFSDPSHITAAASVYRPDDAKLMTEGITRSRTWACAGAGVAEPTKSGDALVVFTLRGVYNFNIPAGESFWLNRGYAGGKNVQLLAPGYYKTASGTELFILAALVPPRTSSAMPQLIGHYFGVIGATSTPASDGLS
jgi:hypothetical protein